MYNAPKMYEDTIVAIATPPGQGALGVIRLSGPGSKSITEAIFDRGLVDRRVIHGHIYDPRRSEKVDEVLTTYMAGPSTYTGEDVVEISCHGNPIVLQQVLEITMVEGARLANPGEFTLRGFLTGKIDLTQAESVLDVIQAESRAGLRLAIQGLGGRLSKPIKDLYTQILHVQAYLTACIDFPEDEVEAQRHSDPEASLDQAENNLRSLINSADAGMVYRYGVKVAIVGRPNVGKSSLLNRLLGENRAIVTDIPGTTRDTIEEKFVARGIPFQLIDTAGIHETGDQVENMGMARSRLAIDQADLILSVIDSSTPLSQQDRDIAASTAEKNRIIVANKCDLPVSAEFTELTQPIVRISALVGTGIDTLQEEMASAALGGKSIGADTILVTNPRHKAALERSLYHLQAARRSMATQLPEDFATIDLAGCLAALGEITGESVDDDVLEAIFREFCIGK